MSNPSLTFGTLHQTGTALPSRVGELLELQGDVEAEPLGSFEIDDQFELGWSLDRQVGRLLAPEVRDALLARPGFAFSG
jgi:hypothetical protein